MLGSQKQGVRDTLHSPLDFSHRLQVCHLQDYVAIKIVRNIDKYRHAAMIEVSPP